MKVMMHMLINYRNRNLLINAIDIKLMTLIIVALLDLNQLE